MSLSLEVKKFVNSENIGSFVTVTLPSELPVDDAEIRAVRRDKAAAERAAREAQDREDAEKLAERTVTDAERELLFAKDEYDKVDRMFDEAQKKLAELTPGYIGKKNAFDSAKSEYDEKKTLSDALEAEYASAEAARSAAERAHTDAARRLSERKAAFEKAAANVVATAAEEAELIQKLDTLKSELAEMEVVAKRSSDSATELQHRESEQNRAYETLNDEGVSLAVEKRILEKQLQEAVQSEARANKEYQKSKSEHIAAEQQYESLKNNKTSRNPERDTLKLAQAKSKLDTAEADERVRLANLEKETEFVAATREKLAEYERKIIENAEKKRTAQELLEEAKESARKGSDLKLADGSKLAGKRADATVVSSRLEKVKKSLADAKVAETAASASVSDAEAELIRTKRALDDADGEHTRKKNACGEADAVTAAARKIYDTVKTEYDHAHAQYEAADKTLQSLKDDRAMLADRIIVLEKSLFDAREHFSSAQMNSRSASSEAQRLHGSIHVIEAKYETARMHYLESGKGEPIILVHTAGQSLYTFRNIFYKLSMNYRVIALDLVGHGYSDRPDFFDYSIGCHAESIVGFMNELGIESAHILGFSMGAGFALELARRHPERVGRVVAICPGGVTGNMPLMVRMVESGLFGGIASKLYKVKNIEKMLNECVFDHTVIGPADIDQYYRPASDSRGRWAIRRTVAGFDESALIDSLGDIETPVLIVWGEEDKWHPFEDANIYRAGLVNSAVSYVRNAGHLLHEEKPDKLFDLVRAFIPAGYGNDED
ncbi:MAG: alpha/beta fold hydrolase [Clostridia bacterium]|nr:alpha/beta fold hydrolase [Clostridia bacterium]